MIRFLLILLVLLPISSKAYAGWFWPSNQKECALKYMPKTHSDAAARFVNGACYDLFSEEEHKVKRAKCILRLDELFKAKNNVAAQVILGNSKCNEIKAPKETRIRKTHPVDPITDFMLSIDRDKADETVDLSKDTF